MSSSDKSTWLEKVYSAQNNKELSESYDAWAEDYDLDILSFGYKIPTIMTSFIGRYVAREGSILDAGTGTGILGQALYILGYQKLIGLDISSGMLEKAREKNVYQALHQMDLCEELDFENDSFSASVAMGVFTAGHAPPSAFDELVQVTKPGGRMIFSSRADTYFDQDCKDKLDELKNRGKWQLIEKTDVFQALPLEKPEALNRVFVYSIN